MQVIHVPAPFSPPGHYAHFVRCMLDGLAKGSVPQLRRWGLPPLYQSGVVYRLEPGHGSGHEDFSPPPITYRRGWGDCDDLIWWRLTELLASGENARCRAMWSGPELHVLVRRGNGKLEDPSKILAR